MHMREAIDKLMADFNTFIQENAAFKGYFDLSVVLGVVYIINPHAEMVLPILTI